MIVYVCICIMHVRLRIAVCKHLYYGSLYMISTNIILSFTGASFRQIINIQHWLSYRSISFHAFSPNSFVFSYLRHHPPPPRIHVNVPCVGSKVHIPVHLLHMHMLDELLRVNSTNTLAVFGVVWATIQNDNRKTNMHLFSKSNKT